LEVDRDKWSGSRFGRVTPSPTGCEVTEPIEWEAVCTPAGEFGEEQNSLPLRQ